MIIKSGSPKNAWVERSQAIRELELQAKWLGGMSGEYEVKYELRIHFRNMGVPKCPECGRDMLDDKDGMYGGWICADGHAGVVIYE